MMKGNDSIRHPTQILQMRPHPHSIWKAFLEKSWFQSNRENSQLKRESMMMQMMIMINKIRKRMMMIIIDHNGIKKDHLWGDGRLLWRWWRNIEARASRNFLSWIPTVMNYHQHNIKCYFDHYIQYHKKMWRKKNILLVPLSNSDELLSRKCVHLGNIRSN